MTMTNAKVLNLRADMNNVQAHIHFNNAGDSPMPTQVLNIMQQTLHEEHVHGGYYVQDHYAAELSAAYRSIGNLINASNPDDEIAFVDSATTAWVKAFYSIPLTAGDIILTSHVEYAANYVAMLQQCRRFDASIKVIDSHPDGTVSIPALQQLLEEYGSKVKCVCITWIPTNGGVINDAIEIGRTCLTFGSDKLVYVLDACQAVGQIKVDVQELQCDILSATGRKYLRGPRGTGFLYVNQRSLASKLGEPITIDHYAAPWTALNEYTLLTSARRFEQWERSVVNILGLKAAVDYAVDRVGIDWIDARVRNLGRLLRSKLRSINYVKVWDLGDENSQGGIVSFSITTPGAAFHAVAVKHFLLKWKIYVSVSPPSSTLVDATMRELPEVVRASLHYFNTEEEIDTMCSVLVYYLNQ